MHVRVAVTIKVHWLHRSKLFRSVNEVICHGIPDKRKLKEGDIVNIGPHIPLHLCDGIMLNISYRCLCLLPRYTRFLYDIPVFDVRAIFARVPR